MSEKKVTGKKIVISVELKYAAIRRLDQGEAAVVIVANLWADKSTATGWKNIELKLRGAIQLMWALLASKC